MLSANFANELILKAWQVKLCSGWTVMCVDHGCITSVHIRIFKNISARTVQVAVHGCA